MQQSRTPARIVISLLLLISFFNVFSPASIIQAIIPLAVPTVNRTAGATAKFLICDSSENCVIAGSYTSGSLGGGTGALDLVGATSGNINTLTADDNTATASNKLPGVNGILPAISGTPVPGNCVNWATAKTLGDAGAACGSGGGGNSSGFTVYSGLAGISLTGTIFFPFGGGNPASTTETVVQTKVAAAATMSNFGANLSVALGTTLGVNNSVALTFRDNTSSQSLTCTITNPATACVDTTHNFTTASGDLIDVQAVFTGTISATPVFLMSVQVGAAPVGGGGSFVLVEQHTASSSADLEFTTCFTSTYDNYQLSVVNLEPATDGANLTMQFSTNGGSSWLAGTTYAWSLFFMGSGGDSGVQASGGDSSIRLAGQVGSATAGAGSNNTIFVYNPLSASANKRLNFATAHAISGSGAQYNETGAGAVNTTTATNAFRLIFSTGNIASGVARCYGLAH